MEILGRIIGDIDCGYAWALPQLLLLWLALPTRPSARRWLPHLNLMLAGGAVLNGLVTIAFYLWGYNFGNDFDRFAMVNRILGPYWYVTGATVLLGIVLPMFMCWPRLRNSVMFSLVCCLSIWLLPVLTKMLMRIQTQDYLPSSWSMTYELPSMGLLDWIAFFVVLYLIGKFSRRKSTDPERIAV